MDKIGELEVLHGWKRSTASMDILLCSKLQDIGKREGKPIEMGMNSCKLKVLDSTVLHIISFESEIARKKPAFVIKPQN